MLKLRKLPQTQRLVLDTPFRTEDISGKVRYWQKEYAVRQYIAEYAGTEFDLDPLWMELASATQYAFWQAEQADSSEDPSHV